MRFIFESIYKIFLLGIVVFSIFIFFVDFVHLKFITADGSIYLNIAENIANHKGFVVSYNLCQCFKGLYHPIWAYYQPLYPIFASFFINHGGMVEVIKANIFIFALNAILIFYIVERIIPSFFNLLFCFFLVISLNFYLSALFAWTEQLHFFCFIVTFILFLKFKDNPKHLLWLGFLNGIFMFIRVAHLYNFLAYLPVIFIGKDSLREKFNRAFSFVGGFTLAYGAYQLFCLLVYHTFYPYYARPGASYGMARFDSGIVYDLNKVGLQVPFGPVFYLQHLSYVGEHLRDFYKQMPNFLWPALFYYFLPAKKRLEGGLVELCFLQSIFTVFGYSLTFYWLTFSFDALRYSMIPYVLLSVVGWYCMYQGLQFSESIGRKLFGLLILGCLFLSPQVHKAMVFRNTAFNHPLSGTHSYRDMLASYAWINKNLPKEVLVASWEDQAAYYMHRPFISIPPGKAFNCTNLTLFNRIYSPDYYLLLSSIPDKCFAVIPHQGIYFNRTFRILEVKKNKSGEMKRDKKAE